MSAVCDTLIHDFGLDIPVAAVTQVDAEQRQKVGIDGEAASTKLEGCLVQQGAAA